MLRKILFAAIAFMPMLFLNKDIAFADTSTNSETTTTTTTTTTTSSALNQIPSAVKVSVVDGIVKYVEGVKKATIALEWDPLPVSELLNQSLSRYNKEKSSPITIKIRQRNNDKSIACDFLEAKNDEQSTLYEALGVKKGSGGNNNCVLEQDADLQAKEISALTNEEGIRPSEYIAMSRERSLLKTLLSSKGIEYAFDIKDGNSVKVPNFTDEKVSWQITIYKYKWIERKNLYYYRFNIKAIVEPFDKNIYSDNGSFQFTARIQIKDRENQTSIPNKYFYVENLEGTGSSVSLVKDPTVESNLTKLKNKDGYLTKTFSSLEDVFSVIGGTEKLGTVVQGFLGGTDNSSVISGSLLDFSNGGIAPLIGVNQELGKVGNISTGIIFGVGLGGKTSIFLGPSIRASIFTISAGGTVGAREQSDIGFAGLVSVDLSRLSGNKKDINTVQLQSPTTGNLKDIREQMDTEISNNTLLRYALTSTKNNDEFQLERAKLADGKDDPTKTKVSVISDKRNKLIYLPRGIYKYIIPKGKSIYLISYQDNRKIKTLINSESELSLIGDESLTDLTWEIN